MGLRAWSGSCFFLPRVASHAMMATATTPTAGHLKRAIGLAGAFAAPSPAASAAALAIDAPIAAAPRSALRLSSVHRARVSKGEW